MTLAGDGSAEPWTRNRTVNRSAETITSLSWGAADHIVWRRYYPAGARDNLEVVYQLSSAGSR